MTGDETHVPERENDFAADFAALREIVAAFQSLDQSARARLLRTAATFFKLELVDVIGPAGGLGGARSNPPTAPVATFSEKRAPSPKEFMLDKKPTSDVEKITCLAYYLTHFRDTPHFKTLDLSALNTEAAQAKLSNAAQAVDNATKRGMLAPAVKGMKQLSAFGELYVQRLPDREAAREVTSNVRPRKRSRRAGRGNSNVESSPLNGEQGKR